MAHGEAGSLRGREEAVGRGRNDRAATATCISVATCVPAHAGIRDDETGCRCGECTAGKCLPAVEPNLTLVLRPQACPQRHNEPRTAFVRAPVVEVHNLIHDTKNTRALWDQWSLFAKDPANALFHRCHSTERRALDLHRPVGEEHTADTGRQVACWQARRDAHQTSHTSRLGSWLPMRLPGMCTTACAQKPQPPAPSPLWRRFTIRLITLPLASETRCISESAAF